MIATSPKNTTEDSEGSQMLSIVHRGNNNASIHRKKRRNKLVKVALGVSLLFVPFILYIIPLSATYPEDKTGDKFSNLVISRKNVGDDHSQLPKYAPVVQPINIGDEPQKPVVQSQLSAAEALQCPDSVINFVINATDAKDECDGLRKAFDKTCGDNKDHHHTTRRLSEDVMVKNDSWYNDMFNVIEEYAYESKRFLNGLLPLKNSLKHRRLLEDKTGLNENETTQTVEEEVEDYGEGSTETIEEKEQKPLSPTLPTIGGHMSDEMANEALGLNTELSDIAKAIEELSNATHHSNNDEAATGAADSETSAKGSADPEKSSADLASTAIAVSAVINNPEVIETQSCCRSILTVFHDECDSQDEEDYADRRLFVIVCVIGLCGMIKSLIRHFKIRWLPEAGGCILVGVIGGLFLKILPHIDFAFSHDMFLRVMVPPIVFEAALNIDKRSFRKMLIPIFLLAFFGTIMSTLLTAGIVFYGTLYLPHCTNIPFIESLAFGALISSIDPIAVLSVLSNMGMSDKDQIYVIIFGESLLNDGVAIVLFQTLLHFMDENLIIDSEAVYLATLQFLVIAIGSLLIGLLCGLVATFYFWLMQGIQTPLVEVIMFICWAFIPYYLCDGVEWSGIVAIVSVGFFMDVYIIGNKSETVDDSSDGNVEKQYPDPPAKKRPIRHSIFSQEGFLSAKAKSHIRFVTEINSTLMETAIFSYLGIFLFNKRYHWNVGIPLMAIFACITSRSFTVWFFSWISNLATRFTATLGRKVNTACYSRESENKDVSIIDGRMQLVLIFAGLRGAMSFALVETVPMYDESTGQGSRLKPELKAMTSACIIFTVFFLGGYTYYLLDKLGMRPSQERDEDVEMVSLLNGKIDENRSGDLKHRTVARAIVSDEPIEKMMW